MDSNKDLTNVKNKLVLLASTLGSENLFFDLSNANPDILLGSSSDKVNFRRLLAEIATKSLNVGIVRYILNMTEEKESWTRHYSCWVNILYWASTVNSREIMLAALEEIENEECLKDFDDKDGYHGALDLAITNNDTKAVKTILKLINEDIVKI